MKSTFHAALRCGLVLAIAMGCAAQERLIHQTLRVKVKPDRMADWQAAIKEYNAHLKKAGWDRSTYWWQAVTGPNEFVRVRTFSKFADMPMGPNPRLKEIQPELTSLMLRMQQCTDSTEVRLARHEPDVSLPRTAEPPKMIRLIETTVRPGKTGEFQNLMKTVYFPAVKASGVKSHSMYRVNFGGSRTEFYSATGMNSMAELDDTPPAVKAMGDEKYEQFVLRMSELIERSRINIYRFREDLSYVAAPTGTPSGN